MQVPEGHKRSPIGVAVAPDGTPWVCPSCCGLHVEAPDCPGRECLCGHNEHGRNVVTLDGGVRMMPEFAERFRRKTTRATVRIVTSDDFNT
jgi:hypothetical protein